MQLLRRHRHPVSGTHIAAALSVSLRTLYRDIGTLQANGACIEGSPGVGYVLQPGYVLPPLMFSSEEIEALVLGSRWVAQLGDAPLAAAARDAIAKIAAVLPIEARHDLEGSGLLVGPRPPADGGSHLPLVRKAIREERKLSLAYRDGEGRVSERVVWPIALGVFDRCHVAVAWCELRQGIRHFRLDRMSSLQSLGERYPRRRRALMKQWREALRIPEPL